MRPLFYRCNRLLKRRFSVGACLFFLLLLPGCTSGEMGTVFARSETFRRAYVVRSYSVGLCVSPQRDTRGLTLGYRQTAYFYPRNAATTPGWSVFRTRLPERPPMAAAVTSLGLGISFTPFDAGFCLGLERCLGLRFPLDGEGWYLRIQPSVPENTVIERFNPTAS